MAFKDLDTKTRYDIIRTGVRAGITKVSDIERLFDEGGHLYGGDEETMQYLKPSDFLTPENAKNRYGDSWFSRKIVENVEKLNYNEQEINELFEQAQKDPQLAGALMGQIKKLWFDTIRNKFDPERYTIEKLRDFATKNPDLYKKNAIQSAFLLDRDAQRNFLKEAGYTEIKPDENGKIDYGLVNQATRALSEDRNGETIPMFQRYNDDITRDKIVPLGNPKREIPTGWYTRFFKNVKRLEDPYRHPATMYMDTTNGNIYKKDWDLNDYGEHVDKDNSVRKKQHWWNFLNPLETSLGNVSKDFDLLGSPMVVTSGYNKLGNINELSDFQKFRIKYGLKNRPENFDEMFNKEYKKEQKSKQNIQKPKVDNTNVDEFYNYYGESPAKIAAGLTVFR